MNKEMELKDLYKFPEGTNVTHRFIPHWLIFHPNFPCPADMEKMFYYYKGVYIPPLDTSKVTNMREMFYFTKAEVLDLSTWDTSKVTNMSGMFSFGALIYINVSTWDTSKVTDMSGMFRSNRKLTSLDLSGWDTSKVTTMNGMFEGCETLTSIDLTGWDTSKVTDMNAMFNSCKNLTSLSALRADSLNIPSYSSPFGSSNNTVLTDFGGFINLKSSWNGSYSVEMLTALSHQSLLNILNGLYDFTGNGVSPTSSQGKLKLGSTHLATLTDDEKAIATDKGWVLS